MLIPSTGCWEWVEACPLGTSARDFSSCVFSRQLVSGSWLDVLAQHVPHALIFCLSFFSLLLNVKSISSFPYHCNERKSTAMCKYHLCSNIRKDVRCQESSCLWEEVPFTDCCWQRRDVQHTMREKTFPHSEHILGTQVSPFACPPCRVVSLSGKTRQWTCWEDRQITGRLRRLENDSMTLTTENCQSRCICSGVLLLRMHPAACPHPKDEWENQIFIN